MYQIAIIEDEKAYSATLEGYLKRYAHEKGAEFKIALFTDMETFLLPRSECFDIVFFDIELPGMNGMDGARRFRRMDPNAVIIFITNLAKFAISGYEVDAMDYMLKPVSYGNLAMKLKKAIRQAEQRKYRMLMLRTKEGIYKVRTVDLQYVESRGHTLTFHTDQGDIDVTGKLSDYEEELALSDFYRCDRCYLVSMARITRTDGNDLFLMDGTRLSISRRKKKGFLAEFARYISA